MDEGVGQKIKRLRERQGLTQAALGELCDLDHTAVSRIENDRVKPTRRTLRDVAHALNVTLDELLSYRDDM